MHRIPSELITLYEKNTVDVQKKIQKVLDSPPIESDCLGFIYGYESSQDQNTRTNFHMKLGRTERSEPHKRISEQGGNMIFIYKTPYNKQLEHLIHLFFDYCRQTRIMDNGKQTEWFYFEEKINIVKYVSILGELVEDLSDSLKKILDDLVKAHSEKPMQIGTEDHPEPNINVETKAVAEVSSEQNTHTIIQINVEAKININTASCTELKRLPKIGVELSKRIVAYRQNHRFETVDDITKIPGIGSGIYTRIKNLVIV